MVQGVYDSAMAGVCIAAQPQGGSKAEDVDSGIVADARGRGHQLVDGQYGVVELAWLALPHRQAAFLQQHTRQWWVHRSLACTSDLQELSLLLAYSQV